MVLSQVDWSTNLNGYFAIDWSHLWLPYKNSQNQIKVMREPHMKHNVTQFEEKNEPINFSHSVLGNYFINIELGNYQVEEASNGNYFIKLEPGNYQAKEANSDSDTQSELLHFSRTDNIDFNIVNLVSNLENNTNYVDVEDRFWFLYFDGSKTQEGSGAGCVMIDPDKNKHFLSCRLDFECTNNIAEYEALV